MLGIKNHTDFLKTLKGNKLFILPLVLSFFFHFYNLGYSELAGDEANPLRFAIIFLYGLVDPKFFGSIFLFHHVPLRILINIPMIMGFGTGEFIVRFPSALLGFLSIFLIYKISEELFDKRTALLASLLYSVSGISLINRLSMGVGPFVFFSLLAFLFTVKFYKTKHVGNEFKHLKKISVSIALAVLFYLEAVLFLPGILYAVIKKRGMGIFKQKRFWKSIIIFPILILLFIIPWIIVPHIVPGIDPAGSYGYILQRVDSSTIDVFKGLNIFIAYNSIYFVALMFVGIAVSLIFFLKRPEMKLIIMYILFFYISFTFLINTPTIHHMHAIPFLIIMGSSGLIMIFDLMKKHMVSVSKYIFLVIILTAVILSSFHTYSVLSKDYYMSSEESYTPTGVWHLPMKNGWKAAGYFIRTNTDTDDYFFADEDGYKTRIYLGRQYYSDMASFFDDIETEEWSKVKYILLTRFNTSIWKYVTENYPVSAIVYVRNKPSLYIFGREKTETEILHNEDYEYMFDMKYGNVYKMLPYLKELRLQ